MAERVRTATRSFPGSARPARPMPKRAGDLSIPRRSTHCTFTGRCLVASGSPLSAPTSTTGKRSGRARPRRSTSARSSSCAERQRGPGARPRRGAGAQRVVVPGLAPYAWHRASALVVAARHATLQPTTPTAPPLPEPSRIEPPSEAPVIREPDVISPSSPSASSVSLAATSPSAPAPAESQQTAAAPTELSNKETERASAAPAPSASAPSARGLGGESATRTIGVAVMAT